MTICLEPVTKTFSEILDSRFEVSGLFGASVERTPSPRADCNGGLHGVRRDHWRAIAAKSQQRRTNFSVQGFIHDRRMPRRPRSHSRRSWAASGTSILLRSRPGARTRQRREQKRRTTAGTSSSLPALPGTRWPAAMGRSQHWRHVVLADRGRRRSATSYHRRCTGYGVHNSANNHF